MKKIYGICVSFLFATQLNAFTEQEVQSATRRLFRNVKSNPYDVAAIKEAIADGADLTHVGIVGDILCELLCSANRQRDKAYPETKAHFPVLPRLSRTDDGWDRTALQASMRHCEQAISAINKLAANEEGIAFPFPLESLQVLLDAGANPFEAKEYVSKYGTHFSDETFVEKLDFYKKMWPDLYDFMNDWIRLYMDDKGFAEFMGIAFIATPGTLGRGV